MKLNRLKSIVNDVLRTSAATEDGYRLDPFEHYTPEVEITVDLINGKLSPEREGDDVEKYYRAISKWFRDILPKEGLSLEVIEKATLIISPKGKKCIVEADGRQFKAEHLF
ncbi:hypothetical protein LCGC14_0864300 [marine sediment metagenome]|uniref:Uncharacterized protein n=1 Tax=marine sediment metagenome TaxID=412755 RepID=A0A0F9PBH7_9ZZZZ